MTKNTITKTFAGAAAVVLALTLALPSQARALSEDQMRIARRIQQGIATLPNYGLFDSLSFAIDGPKVILNGEASRPTLKKSAERVVKKIEGVKEVENNIEVLPNSRFDDELRARAYFSIYGHATLSRYNPNRGTPMWITPARVINGITQDPPRGYHPIHIIVKNGNVRLEGVVDTQGDKSVAGMQANGVRGAFQVTNDLMVAKAATNNAD